MADEAKKAAEEQGKDTKTATAEAAKEAKVETKAKEATIGEVIQPQKESKKDEPIMVPEAALLEYKNANKELKKDLKDLKKLIEDGTSRKEVSADLKAIAEEHNVDVNFLEKFAKAVRSQAETDIEEKYEKPRAAKEQAREFEKVFNEHYDKALDAMPEYKGLASKDVIKSLVKDPKNASKTFSTILEEAYGHLITGRKTLEPTKPGGGKEDAEIDFAKAQKDPAYFKELMSDPHMKKKYNESLVAQMAKIL